MYIVWERITTDAGFVTIALLDMGLGALRCVTYLHYYSNKTTIASVVILRVQVLVTFC